MLNGEARNGGVLRLCALCCAMVLGAVLAACGGGGGAEEEFPSKQIEIIVPWDPGGGTDQTARQLASVAEETCGTNIIVSNQTGSTGAVGFQAAANAEPDGHTIGLATVEISMINHLGVAEVTPEDVRGVMQYNFDPAAISVGADTDYRSIDDLISAAESGQNIRVGTSGTGSIWHVAFAGMAQKAGVAENMTNVPFDGAAPAIQAVLGGQIEATSASGAEVRPQVESGDLRPLAVMADERLDILPDTPTLKEEGIDWTTGAWRGLVVPNDTPDDRVETLNRCFKEAYDSEQFRQFMEQNGFGMQYKPADEFEAFMDEEYERFGRIIESLDIRQQ
ncbi:ABC transporter substrate-binding protein [Rubrobacter xylanophilus]|uniref:ABC transporter substrate-binding protein n=1 Tax=Rubrobacter xylanophilus TaxID=49319 RepID=A0A510HII2_9ACTN|nr:ABC transporter substrate-binding protein [Rubrobacter xylanophilus]